MKIEATVYDIGMMRPDGSIGVLMHAQTNDDSAVRGVKVGTPATLIVDEPAMTWISTAKEMPNDGERVVGYWLVDWHQYVGYKNERWTDSDGDEIDAPDFFMRVVPPTSEVRLQAAQDVLGA